MAGGWAAWGAFAFIAFLAAPAFTGPDAREGAVYGNDACVRIDVLKAGAKGDGATDDTKAVKAAMDKMDGGTLYFPPGAYVCSLSVRKSRIAIAGAGSSLTTLRMPEGVDGNVLELGDTAAGNGAAAYESVSVSGLTLDGNRKNTPAPATDLTGWGMPVTRVSDGRFSDVRAVNCWNGGVGFFINSDGNTGSFKVEDCGSRAFGTPGFDINSSGRCVFRVESVNCPYGCRVLDNCNDNELTFSISDAELTGLVCDNQPVNTGCTGNRIRVTVDGGITDQAVLIGRKWHDNVFDITVRGSGGGGVNMLKSPGGPSGGNLVYVNSSQGSHYAARVGSDNNTVDVTSYLDGRAGKEGSSFAVDVYGSGNRISADITDSSPWHVRGVVFRPGSSGNVLTRLNCVNSKDPILDQGRDNGLSEGRVLWKKQGRP